MSFLNKKGGKRRKNPRVVVGFLPALCHGAAVDHTAAAGSAPDVDQHHVCFLFQKVLLRGLDDVFGFDHHPVVCAEERRQRRGEHEVSFFFFFFFDS